MSEKEEIVFIKDGVVVDSDERAERYIKYKTHQDRLIAHGKESRHLAVLQCVAYDKGYHAQQLGLPDNRRDSQGKRVTLIKPYTFGYLDAKAGRLPDLHAALLSQAEFDEQRRGNENE